MCERAALSVAALAAVAGPTMAEPTASKPVIAAIDNGLRFHHAEISALVSVHTATSLFGPRTLAELPSTANGGSGRTIAGNDLSNTSGRHNLALTCGFLMHGLYSPSKDDPVDRLFASRRQGSGAQRTAS